MFNYYIYTQMNTSVKIILINYIIKYIILYYNIYYII